MIKEPRGTEAYKRMTVLWHHSVDARFEPVVVVKALAESLGLVIRESTSGRTGRITLRIDTRESKATKGKGSLLDKATRRAAAKLFRQALSDPAQAERIKALIQRQAAGEDVAGDLAKAIDR